MPDETSRYGLSVPQLVLEHGDIKAKMRSIPNVGKYMPAMINSLNTAYRELYNQPKNAKTQISQDDLDELMTLLKECEIDDIGFTQVDTSFIFSNKRILYKNAIVILMKMSREYISTAPSKAAEREIFRTYLALNQTANKVKEFLNDRGYRAQAGPALGGEVNYPLLAQKAGMGAIGRHGLLITPKFGPSLRLGAIYTDIENLPLNTDNEHLWIRDFCDKCGKCVRKCPANAIYAEPKVSWDGSVESIDYKKCAVPFSKNKGCTICVKECIFFDNNYDKIKSNFVKNK